MQKSPAMRKPDARHEHTSLAPYHPSVHFHVAGNFCARYPSLISVLDVTSHTFYTLHIGAALKCPPLSDLAGKAARKCPERFCRKESTVNKESP